MTLNKPIIFAAGLIVGAGSGVLVTWQYFKQKYEKQAQEEIQDALDYIQETSNYRGNNLVEDDAEINPVALTDEERKERLLRNEELTTNYASMYKNKQDPDPNIQMDFREAELDEGDDEEETPEQEANHQHQENRNKPPRIISVEEYENLPAYIERDTLYYYHYDEIVADDNEEEIVDPESLIGDALDKYGFRDSDESIIFVFNPAIDTAYEIQRVMGAFTDGNV